MGLEGQTGTVAVFEGVTDRRSSCRTSADAVTACSSPGECIHCNSPLCVMGDWAGKAAPMALTQVASSK